MCVCVCVCVSGVMSMDRKTVPEFVFALLHVSSVLEFGPVRVEFPLCWELVVGGSVCLFNARQRVCVFAG